MSAKIVVPELGESVVEARVARWLKQEGEPVAAGEAIVELETDKVNLEVGADEAGVLARIEHGEGAAVRPGDVLGFVEPAGAVTVEEPEGAQQPSPPAEASTSAPQPSPPAEAPAPTRDPQGPAATPVAPEAEPRREERLPMSLRRKTIARRMVEAQHAAAMLTTFNEVDMESVMALRARARDSFQTRHGVKLGIVSFFVRAAAAALKAFPRLNAEIQGEEIVLKHYYDIGIAVGAEDGLVVPVLRDVDRLTFAQIEAGIADFATRAEEGGLTIEDLRGGTFTITNGGVFGSLLSTPILNPPQVGILGLHAIQDRPVARDGAVVVRPMMYVALSYDHRLVDGREAVQFLARIKELVEDPAAMILQA